mgnify:CR=1 FL=1
MLDKKIGFIGSGNMGRAMIGGIISSGLVPASHLIASAKTQATLDTLSEQYGIRTTLDNETVAVESDIIFLAVKPYLYETVIKEIKDSVTDDKIIVAIAAGQTISRIESLFSKDIKLVRTMPNTPALVGEGITGVCKNNLVTEDEFAYVLKLLSSFGLAEAIPESLMDAVVSVSGSSPAYVFLFIEAMADAAVADGMPRAQAYKFAAQAVLGSAKMVLETGKHPAELKDMVCSPAGTTIEAVRVLEEKGFRGAVMDAMKACTAKAKGI